jgi:outer membrane cobalamin receptor
MPNNGSSNTWGWQNVAERVVHDGRTVAELDAQLRAENKARYDEFMVTSKRRIAENEVQRAQLAAELHSNKAQQQVPTSSTNQNRQWYIERFGIDPWSDDHTTNKFNRR